MSKVCLSHFSSHSYLKWPIGKHVSSLGAFRESQIKIKTSIKGKKGESKKVKKG